MSSFRGTSVPSGFPGDDLGFENVNIIFWLVVEPTACNCFGSSPNGDVMIGNLPLVGGFNQPKTIITNALDLRKKQDSCGSNKNRQLALPQMVM